MRKPQPINKCVHDNRYLHQDAGGQATMLGGDSAIVDSSLPSNNSGLGICTCVPNFDVNTGSGGAPLDNQSFYTNQYEFPSWFDNSPVCNNTCLLKCHGEGCCGSSGVNLGNVTNAINKLASLLKGSKNTKKSTVQVAAATEPTPTTPKPISTQAYVIGGAVGIVVLIVIGIVASAAIGRNSGAAQTAKA